ncbi:MAG: type II toxin-antitoxin system VapC family toxin [Proteobacteria bacterium]|nr:type II toxin-antitoxin system VapC family toxin [Pseudomonadota bacterium]
MALAWLFERQDKQAALCASNVLVTLRDAEVLVPSLWHTEISNALLLGERCRVVTEAQVIDYLNRLSALPITTDVATVASRRELVMALAREHGLTAYDAVYLDLALRTDSVLATFDVQLASAMQAAGGTVFGKEVKVLSAHNGK